MNNGLSVDLKYNDLGRYRVTQQKDDSFKFKVPTLRNIEFSYPYMHDGRFKKLAQVFNHYGKVNSANANSTLAKELRNGIVLTSDEKVELTAFLLTLTDKTFLFNKDHSFPKHIFLNN
jgi:cytochrome c peroxidase